MKQSLRSSKYFKCETVSITNSTSEIFLNNYSNYPIRLRNEDDNIVISGYTNNLSIGSNNIVISLINNPQNIFLNDCINITNYADRLIQSNGSICIASKGLVSADIVRIGENSICIGNGAGISNNSSNTIAIGYLSGYSNKEKNTISIGALSSSNGQGENSICIGDTSAATGQQRESIILGSSSAEYQDSNSIILGSSNIWIVRYGAPASQQKNAICIGSRIIAELNPSYSGVKTQQEDSIAIGRMSVIDNLGRGSIAITSTPYGRDLWNHGSIADYSIVIGAFGSYERNVSSKCILIGNSNFTDFNYTDSIHIGNNHSPSQVTGAVRNEIFIGNDIQTRWTPEVVNNILALSPSGADSITAGSSGGFFVKCPIGSSNINLPSSSNKVAFYDPYTYEVFLSTNS